MSAEGRFKYSSLKEYTAIPCYTIHYSGYLHPSLNSLGAATSIHTTGYTYYPV